MYAERVDDEFDAASKRYSVLDKVPAGNAKRAEPRCER